MKKQLGAYDSFLMTLVFERAGKVEVEVMVEEASILEPAHEMMDRAQPNVRECATGRTLTMTLKIIVASLLRRGRVCPSRRCP